jgi:hypothetical protein
MILASREREINVTRRYRVSVLTVCHCVERDVT